MKQLLIILALGLFACKKETVKPTPPPTPTPTCATGINHLTGKWYAMDGSNHDTVYVTLLSNRCPLVNSNTYLFVNLYKAAQHGAATGYTFSPVNDTIQTTSENDDFQVLQTSSIPIGLRYYNNGIIIVFSDHMQSQVYYYKAK